MIPKTLTLIVLGMPSLQFVRKPHAPPWTAQIVNFIKLCPTMARLCASTMEPHVMPSANLTPASISPLKVHATIKQHCLRTACGMPPWVPPLVRLVNVRCWPARHLVWLIQVAYNSTASTAFGRLHRPAVPRRRLCHAVQSLALWLD